MFSFIHALFLNIFIIIYPYYHSNLVSYLLILLSCIFLIHRLKKSYKNISTKRGSNSFLPKIVLGTGMGIVGTFTIWFVFIHFQSFLALP